MHPAPFIVTFFGITGDLSQQKLIPALFELFCRGELPSDFSLIGYGRREFTVDAFRDFITQTLPNSDEVITFLAHWHYVRGEFDSDADFSILADTIEKIDPANEHAHFFYLAVAPEFYVPLTTHLNNVHLLSMDRPKSAVLIEKPYGTDAASAQALTDHLDSIITESQIFRVDHFLSKQPSRDLTPPTDIKKITGVDIVAAEIIGIGTRGAYYDAAGVIRDMVQNHCLMLLAHFLSLDDRVRFLQSLTVTHTITGQYDGYVDEPNVSPNSTTETYAALTLASADPNWAHITFRIKTGKYLAEKTSHITVHRGDASTKLPLQPHPDQATHRSDYASVFFDAFTANHSFFIAADEVLAAWRIIDPVIKSLTNKKPVSYARGSWGPE